MGSIVKRREREKRERGGERLGFDSRDLVEGYSNKRYSSKRKNVRLRELFTQRGRIILKVNKINRGRERWVHPNRS
jgi:hypothetical protein